MADKQRSYGQFDGGKGQAAARRGSAKRVSSVGDTTPRSKPKRAAAPEQPDQKSEDEVRRDMRELRRKTVTMGMG